MLYFLVVFGLSLATTYCLRTLARRFGIVDEPNQGRKRHAAPAPLLGGAAIFVAFWLVVWYLLIFHPILGLDILKQKLWWVFLASLLLILLGVADDIRGLPVSIRLVVTVLAAIIAVAGGLGLSKITNPFGGVFSLPWLSGSILVFLWLMGMMYTTKISDGMDGLAAGIVAIGAVMISLFSATTKFFQPNVSLLALVFAGSCLGFLIFNFHPASIFLGEGGSLFIGFMLGVLAVISGGKLATALLVMAIPIFDLARVIAVRRRSGRSIFQADREHFYFKLLDRGFSERRIILGLYMLSAFFGASALFLQSGQKIIALLLLFLALAAVAWYSGKKVIQV